MAKPLPALTRAEKLQKRAARVGFDWPDMPPVFDKIHEEIDEFKAEITAGSDKDRLEDEFGDILFAVVNLGRKVGLDPETALKRTNNKFTNRFKGVEEALRARGKSPEQSNLDEMDQLWNEMKKTRG